MGLLENEVEDASRGRKVSTQDPSDVEFERHARETEESFQKVNDDRDAQNKRKSKP